MQKLSETERKEFKSKITDGFKALRKAGYTAKQDFMCCQSCAWSAIEEDESIKNQNKVVFYHSQDAADILYGECRLAWEGNGAEIVQTLRDAGLNVVWSGDEDARIKLVA